ncbi:MAG: hypothetical protein MRY51_08115 [Flavobacteriaceae bacterium]|nr:hypothetical protein [Flavobacteriaceae bacterium]MCI5087889.1 hypothetical protein [Flavobacteriaceae bacterium]
MKNLLSILLMFFLLGSTANAQSSIKENEVLGPWRFHLELSKEINKASSDLNFFERMVAGAVSGIVDTAMEQIDIQFLFKKGQKVILTIHNKELNETKHETLHWFINDQGQLEIDDLENENIKVSSDGVWVLKDNKLVVLEGNKLKEGIYLERL